MHPPHRLLRTRLSVLMLLQFAVAGSWLPVVYPFLANHRGFSPGAITLVFAALGVGATAAIVAGGQIADRHLPADRLLGVGHLAAAVLMWHMADARSAGAFVALTLGFSLLYGATVTLGNAVCLAHLRDADRDFGRVRLWGTVGWIAAGLAVGHWIAARHTPAGPEALVRAAQHAGRADGLRCAALAGACAGLHALLFLPRTPPARHSVRRNAPAAALAEVRRPRLAVLFAAAVPLAAVDRFYLAHGAELVGVYERGSEATLAALFGAGGGGLLTLGQLVEVATLAAIPLLLRRASYETLLTFGAAAFALRMAVFAWSRSAALVLTAVALHGVCFALFFFVGFLVVERETRPDLRASAQGLFQIVFGGLGALLGGALASGADAWARGADGTLDPGRLFAIPLVLSSAACLTLLVAWRGGRRPRAG